MFQHNRKSNIPSDSPRNGGHQYKIYSYIAALGISEMVNKRIKKASEWLGHPSSLLYARTFYEADQSIHRQRYDLIITDNESYYKLIEHLSVFKIKIEQDFFSNDDDPLLSAKPLYYHPQTNTLFIREHSSHNSRFLYEVLRIALTPPVIAIDATEANLHHFKQVRNSLHVIFPYSKICHINDEYCPQHIAPDYCLPLQCNIQSSDDTFLIQIDDSAAIENNFRFSQQKDMIDFLWRINTLLEHNGCLSFYNDYQEIVRCYNRSHA